jgi:hypothetical protein
VSDHDDLIGVARRWEALYNEKCAELERLRVEFDAFWDCHTAECYGCPCCAPAASGVSEQTDAT